MQITILEWWAIFAAVAWVVEGLSIFTDLPIDTLLYE